MKIVGSFDRPVGIEYSLEQSSQKGYDLWYTDEEFTYFIGPVKDQRYVTIPKGFFTDGASVPRLFWSIFPPWGAYGQAAIVHDYLCINKKLTKNGESVNLVLSQKEIDKVLYQAMKVAGTSVWTRSIIYTSVRIWHSLRVK